MRPLFHPSPSEITVEGILHALSDPVRATIFSQIASADCPQKCSTFLETDSRKLPKSTLSVHFRILREAGLIRSQRQGVELHNTARCQELQPRFGPLITAILQAHASQSRRQGNPRKKK